MGWNTTEKKGKMIGINFVRYEHNILITTDFLEDAQEM
jgi:hypothetical protein